jgi:ABC-type bacteriocin/lantibiotic exporter with double-glycine peptidase domain
MIDIIRKMLKLMSPDSIKTFRVLAIISILSAIVETFGLAFIFPFIAVLSSPNYIEHSSFLLKIYHFFGFSTINQFLLLIGLLLLATVVFGNMLIAYTMWRIYRFSYMEEHHLSYNLLKKYMSKPYLFFLSNNTSTLLKNVTDEVKAITHGILISLLKIITKVTVATLMLLFLLVYSPLLTLIMLVSVLSLYVTFILFFRDYVANKSNEAVNASTLIYQYTAEALGAIQDIKLMNANDFVLKQFSKPSIVFALSRSAANVLSDTPRYFLDIVIFGGILLYVVIMLLTHNANITHVVPTLAMFGYAGMRIMPAISIVYTSYTQIKFARPSLNVLYNDLLENSEQDKSMKFAKQTNKEKITIQSNFAFEHVSYQYPSAKQAAVDNLSFLIQAYSKVGFVGKTGAGKTTIINLILGLLSPTEGRIIVDNISLNEQCMRSWQTGIGYVPQNIYLIDDTIAKNIAFGLEESSIDWQRLEAVSKIAELHDYIIQDLPNQYHTHVGDRGVRLSGGQRQRIGIARALYTQPKLLVLDEATSALDNETERKVLENIDRISNSMTVIMVAHRLTTLQKCDTIFVLSSEGISQSGTYDELSKTNPIFRAFLQKEHIDD